MENWREEASALKIWILVFWNHFRVSQWPNVLLRCFEAWSSWIVTWECFDVAAGNSGRIGLKLAKELRQMINNMDLVNGACSRLWSLSLFSRRILFFWEVLRGKLSCFHVKGMLLSVCFPGCLKLFTVPGGLSGCVCVFVCERVCLASVCERNHLTVDDATGGRNSTSKP